MGAVMPAEQNIVRESGRRFVVDIIYSRAEGLRQCSGQDYLRSPHFGDGG